MAIVLEKYVSDLLNSFVPISRFNQEEASKIFDEVAQTGVKIVLKNNTPACVLITPERYTELIEMIEDYELALEAEKRLENAKETEWIPFDEILRESGITPADLEAIDDVDIE